MVEKRTVLRLRGKPLDRELGLGQTLAAVDAVRYRVLKRGGRAVISDIVSDEEIPQHRTPAAQTSRDTTRARASVPMRTERRAAEEVGTAYRAFT